MSHSPICDTEEARTVFSDGTLGSNGKVVKLKELLLQSPFSLTQSCDMTREKSYCFFHCEVKNPGDKVGQYVSRPGVTNVWLFRRTVSINNSFDKHRIGSLCQSCIG